MTQTTASQTRFAVCVDNSEYPASLVSHKIYRVLPDERVEQDGDLRVVDESGEDYIFPAVYFVILNVSRRKATLLNQSFTQPTHYLTSPS